MYSDLINSVVVRADRAIKFIFTSSKIENDGFATITRGYFLTYKKSLSTTLRKP